MSDLAAADSGLTAAGKREAKVQKEMHIPLGDRYNMAYMSTIVTYGRGEGIVTATGMDTEIGKIASLINESHEDITPLQKRLGELGKILSLLSLLLCAALFLIALIQKRNMIEMLITAISLAVAAVPGGASRGGHHLPGPERYQNGEGAYHCQKTPLGGNPGRGQRCVLG